MTKPTTSDLRFAAVAARDANADGTFVYSVATTGIYCLPSCGSRAAKRENLAFHDTVADAERSGFRPCKRCCPEKAPLSERRAVQVASLCRVIEAREGAASLDALAAHIGLSTFATHRLFTSVTGLTPKAYGTAYRAKCMEDRLRTEGSVTSAIVAAGYSSSARFYETSSKRLGMTAANYRKGGHNIEIRFAVGVASLGSVLVAATQSGVCAILIGDNPDVLLDDLQRRFANAQFVGADESFEQVVAHVVALVEEPHQAIQLPLDIRGTAFQQRVWQALTRIPAGQTMTYLQIAKAIGAPNACRAVAQACGANPLAVAIPCHRVVRTNGDLSGYRWGIDRKQMLIDREQDMLR